MKQERDRPGISLADASILCTELGGDHNKDLGARVFVLVPEILALILRTQSQGVSQCIDSLVCPEETGTGLDAEVMNI